MTELSAYPALRSARRSRASVAGSQDTYTIAGAPTSARREVVSAPSPARGGSTTIRSGFDVFALRPQKCLRLRVHVLGRAVFQIVLQSFAGHGRRFDGDNVSEIFCQLLRKQAHACEKVPRQPSPPIRTHAAAKIVDKPSIHLEKCAVIHAIVKSTRAVSQRCLAQLRESFSILARASSSTSSAPISAGTRFFHSSKTWSNPREPESPPRCSPAFLFRPHWRKAKSPSREMPASLP